MAEKPRSESFLIEKQILSPKDFARHRDAATQQGISLYSYLIKNNILKDEELAQTLAHHHGVAYHAGPLTMAPGLQNIPPFLLRRHKLLPIEMKEGAITVATADPGNFSGLDEIGRITGRIVHPVCATEKAIDEALARMSSGETVETPPEDPTSPLADRINRVIASAIERGISDLHFEPHDTHGLIRERIDGMLCDVEQVPLKTFHPMLSRLKVLCGMDIVEKRLAQDGRMKFEYQGNRCEVRASSLPTLNGEKMALRLLRANSNHPTLEFLDLGEEMLRKLDRAAVIKDGLILMAGPTGSGKTTTIYSILDKMDRKQRNVITLEDPVEYRLERANQVQINSRIGVTFASMLPHILRQDPDILLVGELRDEATAQMCMKAAISGHVVLSTIHAPTAIGSILRLSDMNIEPHMIVAALKSALSQRLIRQLCAYCKVSYPIGEPERKILGPLSTKTKELYRAQGCEKCNNTGYKGRFVAMEILEMSDALREAVLSKSRKGIFETARKENFRTMFEHAAEKVISGNTSLEEVLSVCPQD